MKAKILEGLLFAYVFAFIALCFYGCHNDMSPYDLTVWLTSKVSK